VKARVMIFGYDAKAAFGDGVAGVKEHARGLLGALGEKRGRSFVSFGLAPLRYFERV
jgi:hypothetical protein